MKLSTTLLRRTAPLAGAMLMASAPLVAQDPTDGASATEAAATALPSAEHVLESFIKASGGRTAQEKIKNRVIEGTLELEAMGLKGDLRFTAARPGKSRARIELGMMGVQEQGTLGKIAWQSSQGGASLLEGNELAARLRSESFDGLFGWKTLYKSASVESRENVDGRSLLKVVMTPPEEGGHPEVLYFDEETHLLAKQVRKADTPMGAIDMTIVYEEYREFDGVKMPVEMRQLTGGQEIVIRFDKVEHNVELPDNAFDPPEAVQALIAKKAAAAPATD